MCREGTVRPLRKPNSIIVVIWIKVVKTQVTTGKRTVTTKHGMKYKS